MIRFGLNVIACTICVYVFHGMSSALQLFPGIWLGYIFSGICMWGLPYISYSPAVLTIDLVIEVMLKFCLNMFKAWENILSTDRVAAFPSQSITTATIYKGAHVKR